MAIVSVQSREKLSEKWLFVAFSGCFFSMFITGASSFNGSGDVTPLASTEPDIHSDVLYRKGPGPSPFPFSDVFPSNSWVKLSAWHGNSPGKRRGHSASHVWTTGADGKVAENMILFGGFSGRTSAFQFLMSWIYTPATNSWRSLFSKIPLVYGHTMVTMCGKRVFLFGGVEVVRLYSDHRLVNNTRSFNGETEAWNDVEVERTDEFIEPRSYHSAVSVYQKSSHQKCQCKESMLVFGGSQLLDLRYRFLKGEKWNTYNDLWELRCIETGYRWFRLNPSSNGSRTPSKRYKAAAASRHDVMFLFGGCSLGLSGECKPHDDLWAYSTVSNQWERLDKSSWSPMHGLSQLVYLDRPSYKSSGRVSGLLLCCRKPFYFYDIKSQQWNTLDTHESDENYEDLVDASVTVIDGDVIVYGGGDYPRWLLHESLWKLTMLASDSCLLHKRPQDPLSPPVRGTQVAVVDSKSNMVIVHGGITADTLFYGYGLEERNKGVWVLDMHSLQWSVRYPKTQLSRMGHVGALLSFPDTVLVIFGGFISLEYYVIEAKSTWGYYPRKNAWIKYETVDAEPSRRRASSAAAINDTSMIMIGGVTIDKDILNDTWVFTLGTKSGTGHWTRLAVRDTPKKFGHTSVLVGETILLFGGMGPNVDGKFDVGKCSDELWEFNLTQHVWRRIDYKGDGPGQRCFHSAAGKGEKMIIVGGCQWEYNGGTAWGIYPYNGTLSWRLWSIYTYDGNLENCRSSDERPSVWYYSVTARHWNKMAPLPFASSAYIAGQLLVWGEHELVAFGGYSVPRNRSTATDADWYAAGFWVTTLGCPAGTESLDFWNNVCVHCSVGQFSQFSSTNCTDCPQGFTTPHRGSASKRNCTLCSLSENVCDHGVCYVPGDLIARDLFERRCLCHRGFTRDLRGKCAVPMAYVVGVGALVVVTVAFCAMFLIIRAVRARRVKSRRQESELADLNQVWKINPKEIALGERIDRDTPGGFGEVYKAEYREMTVAVKKLQNLHTAVGRYTQDFDREIKVMRTLRHPNIVLFFGGGHFDDDGSPVPFLVVEYMPRGSLGAILRDGRVHLGNNQKLGFALDAAEGMAFLHSLSPPRIHRDLKSFNLLVSDRWIVKVADFGATRLVRQEGRSQTAISDVHTSSVTTPLLEADAMLSTDCGSLLWSAPELLKRQDYGTPVDIYSFGIVLWETWERKLPYYDHDAQFTYQIHDLVCKGTRPTISKDIEWPPDIVALMRSCWHHEPHKRPTFNGVVDKLGDLKDLY